MIELVVAALLVGVGVFVSIKVFNGVAKSVFISQTKQVATALAREKLEALQVLAYYRLRAAGAPTYYQPGGSGTPFFYYDPYYTPGPERIQVGNVTYFRGAYIERVYRDPSTGNLAAMAAATPYQTEAGMKRIKSSVMWKDGSSWRVADVTGLKENPNRTRGEVKFVGVITDTNSVPLSGGLGIRVDTVETLGQMVNASPNASGYYEFSIRPGTYTLRVRDTSSAWNYFSAKRSAYVGYETGVTTVNFQLSRFSYGRVDAAFWWNSSPVISRVVGSSASFSNPAFAQEWVEIFNPTTWTWDATKLNLHYYMTHNSSEPAAGALPNTTADYDLHKIDVGYVNTSIPPGGYFLFANTPTIDLREGSVTADAVWETVDPSANAWWRVDRPAGAVGRFDPAGLLSAGAPNPDIITTAETANFLPSQSTWNFVLGVPAVQYNGGGGALRLSYSRQSSTDYIYLDGVGWRGGLDAGCVGGGRDPVVAEENFRLVDKAGAIEDCAGLQAGEQYLRYASTMAWQETRDVGPAYDSNCNVRDWSKYTPSAPGYFARFLPRNSAAAPVPVVAGRDDWTRASNRLAGGNEAGFVNAFVNDGLTPTLDGLKPTYYTGWTPSGVGFCTTCPRSNMFNYTNSDIPWWGRYEFTRVSTGNWTLGLYVRRITGGNGTGGTPGQTPYDYHASSQITVNVTPGSYNFWQGVIGETTDKVFLFGSARDVYDVPLEDLRVEYKFPSGFVGAYTHSRVGGAYSLEYSSSVNQAYVGVHLNNSASGDYVAALNDVYWSPGSPPIGHEFWGGEGYYVNSCACPDTHLPYTGYLAGFVQDNLGAGIPDVVVSAINAATKEERASATTYSTVTNGRPVGWFRINVSSGDYQVRVMAERGETVTPGISGIVNIATSVATAGGIVVGTFTITNAYGNRSGSVVASGAPIQTGVLLVLTTTTIAGSTPTALTAQFRAGAVEYYMTAANATGRYTFDVKMGTYNVYGFYPYFSPTGDVAWVKRSLSAYINSGNNSADFPVLDLTP